MTVSIGTPKTTPERVPLVVPETEAPNAAATILWRLRRPRAERQLTDCLGDLARVDPAIAHGLAKALLSAAAVESAAPAGAGRRAEDLLQELPERLTCSREEPTGKVVVRERSWWRAEEARRGRLDWVFHPPGQEQTKRDFQLAVEVKIGAGLSSNQLADYHQHLSHGQGGPRGLLVLARSVPQYGLLTGPQDHWLGVVLWEQVLPLMRGIRPRDDALAVQWPLFLDVLETRDDVGTQPASWDTMAAPNWRPALKSLVEQRRLAIEQQVRTALAERPTAAATPGDFAFVRVVLTPRRLQVELRVPPIERPVVWINLRAIPAGINVVSELPLHPPTGLMKGAAKARYYDALQTLALLDPPFEQQGRSYVRRIFVPHGEGDLREVVHAAIERELREIARSGVLDDAIPG